MPEVLNISSDEEEGFEKEPEETDFDWIKELLFTSDVESDDSDDVVIVGETKPELKKSKPSTLALKDDDDDDGDDDDCMVLEGDPENGVTSVNEEETDSDELLVVGEKGQIACRDYPHARHLCAKFPFSSTPHEKHCSQCHCYVCDSLAPCLKWGTGILSSDHCHANDKTELWKIERKNFRQGLTSPLPASTNYGTSFQTVRPRCFNVELLRSTPSSVSRHQASRSTGMRTCSTLNSIHQVQASQPVIVSPLSPLPNPCVQIQVSRPINIPISPTTTSSTFHGRCHESRINMVRNRYRPHSAPRQMLGVRSHSIQREKSSPISLGSQFLRPHMMSKRVGSTGDTLTVNRSSHGSSGFNNNVNASQRDKYLTSTRFSNHRNHYGPDDAGHPINSSFYSHSSPELASLGCVYQHTVVLETLSSPLSDNHDLYQTCIHGNDSSSSCVACLNSNISNQHGNEDQIRSEDVNYGENIPQCGIASQDTCQPRPHEENPSETVGKNSAFDSSWPEENISQSIGIEPPVECPPLQGSGAIDQPPSVKESGTRFTVSNEPPVEFFHLPSEFENWLLEKDSVPTVTDDIFPSELNNIPSPEFSPVDTGTLLTQWW